MPLAACIQHTHTCTYVYVCCAMAILVILATLTELWQKIDRKLLDLTRRIEKQFSHLQIRKLQVDVVELNLSTFH